MKIYITRHGQVLNWGIGGDAQFPKGDPPLSPLGREQASCLGAYLKHLGFSGKIYSSPFARALETAQAIAAETGSLIVPWAPIREIVKTKESTANFTGLTLEQIREKFQYIDPQASLPYPWWGLIPELPADVIARVQAGLDALAPQEDILLVGHGASVYCACEALQIPHDPDGNNYNCGFSVYDSEDAGNNRYMSGYHLPYDMRTFNRITQKEEDQNLADAFLKEALEIPQAFLSASGKKILQIGNTRSSHYPYLQKCIDTVKPQIIIHTGNFVDEVKASYIPNVQEEYTEGAAKLSAILKNSGAEKIYVQAGENDIPEVLAQLLPFGIFQLPEDLYLPEYAGKWSVHIDQLHHTFPIPENYHWNRI